MTRRRPRLASCLAAAGVRPTTGAISLNGTSNVSCRTNASLSSGVSVSSTTSRARPTESASSSYAGGILPGLIVFGLFSGICYPALINGALHQTTGQDSGLGSGVQNSMQQIGAALGLATLVTLALRYAGSRISHGVLPAVAQTQGYALAFRVGAAVLAVAGVLVLVLLEHVTARPRIAAAEATPEQAPAPPSLTPGRG